MMNSNSFGRAFTSGLWIVLVTAGCSGLSGPVAEVLPDRAFPYTLPTEMCGSYFIAPVHFGDRGPFPFLLDTGAGTTVVDPSVAREIGLGRSTTLRIGALTSSNVPVRRTEMEGISTALGQRVDGILGHPVFGDYLITYDYEQGRIVLEEGALATGDPGVVPTSDGNRPFVRANIAGREITVLIDTGSSRGLTLTDFEEYPFDDPPTVTGARMRIDGVHRVESARLSGAATVGAIPLENPIVHASVSVDLIGQVYLSEYSLTFDRKNARMRFERFGGDGDSTIPSDPLVGTGVVVAPIDDVWRVIHLRDDVEFDGPGLARGDTIVAVDGKLLSERSCPDPDTDPAMGEWVEYRVHGRADAVRALRRTLVN